jgi:hypothetical protein
MRIRLKKYPVSKPGQRANFKCDERSIIFLHFFMVRAALFTLFVVY